MRAKNVTLGTIVQVGRPALGKYARRPITARLVPALPQNVLPAPIKRQKAPARKINVSDVLQDIIAFWAQHRPIHALKERLAQIWVSHSKASAVLAQQGWPARKQV